MDYAAVISLQRTITRLLDSCCMSSVRSSLEILDSACDEAESLQLVLEDLEKRKSRRSSGRMKELEAEMRDAANKLEDVIESHVSDQFLSQFDRSGDEGRSWIESINIQELRQDVDCFMQTAKKMKEEYSNVYVRDEPLSGEDDDDGVVSYFGGDKSDMVGLSDQFCEIRDALLSGSAERKAVTIVGMAGIGKTALAKKIFEDPLILRKFRHRAFVKIGQNPRLRNVLRAVLTQVNPGCKKKLIVRGDKLQEYFWESLKDRRYLIVLDDVWNLDLWRDFRARLPRRNNQSRILMTTRLQQAAIRTPIGRHATYNIRFMNEEESWDLLRGKVFPGLRCPPELEKAGKKIAENCEGLPLTIVTIAGLLSEREKTLDYWNMAAADKRNSIFMDAYDLISKVLYPSYNYLPQYLKPCFLYMGAFPQSSNFRLSKLINLWRAEGFLDTDSYQSLEDFTTELVSSNLVLVRQRSRYDDKVKACRLHSVFWYLSIKEARNNKFLHVLNSYADGLAEELQGKRRFAIYNNVLFGIKNVYNSMTSTSFVRSLLCTGPHHKYQVPVCCSLRLLRVLDALTIRFYKFPMEVLKLIQLRYLAITYNGEIPRSISKLRNLECLILHQHLSIISSVAESYLPVEIWDLQELKYLSIMGRNLPDPPRGAFLSNLLTLQNVGVHSCTKGILESIPKLAKLRVLIEFAPDAASIVCIPYICELRSLYCVVLNPDLKFKVVVPPIPASSYFIHSLSKLTLSGCQYPWKDMEKIAELRVEVLRLQCYAFCGEEWEAKDMDFGGLKYLLIEDTDLARWTAGDGTFSSLRNLDIKNCYKLQEIPRIPCLEEINLVDCNPSATTCAEQVNSCHVHAESSWNDRILKS